MMENVKLIRTGFPQFFYFLPYFFGFVIAMYQPTGKDLIRYPAKFNPEIAYGNDYSVLGSEKNGIVNFSILTRDMTHILKTLTCPKTEESFRDYTIKAYDSAIFVLINTESKKFLHIYNRSNKEWSDNPVTYYFENKDKLSFGENIIAVAKNSTTITTTTTTTSSPLAALTAKTLRFEGRLEIYDRQSDWKSTSFLTSKALVYLASYQKTVVAYDNSNLTVFYQDKQLNWTKKNLGEFSGFQSNTTALINKLQLRQDAKNKFISSLEKFGLLVFKNFTALIELKGPGGRLHFNVQLFFLNETYDIVKTRNIQINRENIHNLKDEIRSTDKRFTCVKQKGVFKEPEDLFPLDWRQYEIEMGENELRIGNMLLRLEVGYSWVNKTMVNVTEDSDWVKTPIPASQNLGNRFKLKSDDGRKQFKLLRNGQIVRRMYVGGANQIINRYPNYIAYCEGNHRIRLITFKDDENLGEEHVFYGEDFFPTESDILNFVTVANDEVRIRPVSKLTLRNYNQNQDPKNQNTKPNQTRAHSSSTKSSAPQESRKERSIKSDLFFVGI